jgi:hypothetical protein
MSSVLQRWHEQAGGAEFLEPNVSDPEQMLDKLLQTCTVRQVRMLREIALELEEARLAGAPMRMARFQLVPLQRPATVDAIEA